MTRCPTAEQYRAAAKSKWGDLILMPDKARVSRVATGAMVMVGVWISDDDVRSGRKISAAYFTRDEIEHANRIGDELHSKIAVE